MLIKLIKENFQKLKGWYLLGRKILTLVRLHLKKPVSVRQGGKKKVLICYIAYPFKSTNHRGHSNLNEVIVMADVLAELGYAVDVVDYNSEFSIDYSPYDLLIGFGGAFAKSFSVESFRGKRILHLTGANPNFSNEAEAKRSRGIWKRRGVLLAPRREVYWPWMFSAINSDAMFVLGNSWTLSTYRGLNQNAYLIPVPYVAPIQQRIIERDFHSIRHNFCWFSGVGAVHKGLDLLLEAMDGLGNDFHLDVCGPIAYEADFLEAYKDFLFSNPRVHFHGFVDVASQKMQAIMEANTFIIFPSCSEGAASSVITCMAAGLIPVVPKEAGIEIGDFGIQIEYPTIESILETMRVAGSMAKEELEMRSAKSSNYASLKHSYESYAEILRDSLIDVLE